MALDDFRTDENDTDDSDESQQDSEETTSEDEPSGLESFRTDSTRGGSGSDTDQDNEEKSLHDLSPQKWNQMSKDDRVRYMRKHHITDYHPEHHPDDRWNFQRCVEITCVCGNTFTFFTAGICLECGRAYMDAGRTVVKKSDPHEGEDQDNESTTAN